jgi:hypothetical protein
MPKVTVELMSIKGSIAKRAVSEFGYTPGKGWGSNCQCMSACTDSYPPININIDGEDNQFAIAYNSYKTAACCRLDGKPIPCPTQVYRKNSPCHINNFALNNLYNSNYEYFKKIELQVSKNLPIQQPSLSTQLSQPLTTATSDNPVYSTATPTNKVYQHFSNCFHGIGGSVGCLIFNHGK